MTDAVVSNETTYIVGIAASAGGLEALSELAQNLPTEQNCCYVIAQHMSPTHKSMLVQLISRETSLLVEELLEESPIVPNVIYIPPPGADVVFFNGQLELREPEDFSSLPKPSADRLFVSLAQGRPEASIGIVLSGTGSDGSYGIQAIRESGGVTIAQEPSSCKYDSMPMSAIKTGCIDLTLLPNLIGVHLRDILRRPLDLDAIRKLYEKNSDKADLFDILLSQTYVDFRNYKDSTVNRRIQKRMLAKGIDSIEDYVDLCRKSVEEVSALFRDLLISVTRFFRDPDQFRILQGQLDNLSAKLACGENIRVWVPGCATGEEAYSIAILISEALGGIEEFSAENLQVFATDLDENALKTGRKGVYPISALADVPEEFRKQYFEIKQDSIVVKQKLRNCVLFSRHNVFQDAPFTSVDIVSIRNLLIYFDSRLQERVLTRIAYGLNARGILFLGTSETLGVMEPHFHQISPKGRIFRGRDRSISIKPRETALRGSPLRLDNNGTSTIPPPQDPDLASWSKFDRLARSFVKTGIVVDREQSILRVYGDLAPFSELTERSLGQETLAILKRPLAADAASLSLLALKKNEVCVGQAHTLEGFQDGSVRLSAYPMVSPSNQIDDLILISVDVLTPPSLEPKEKESSDYVLFLEEELSRTRDALQVTVEQLQTSNEELQSINEELQSSNEELQATNEELETLNEELQATNEELITVNEELLVNSTQLEHVTAELSGLVAESPSPLLMVDQGLMVRHASGEAIRLFKLSERGDGFGHLSHAHQPSSLPPMVDICSKSLTTRSSQKETLKRDACTMSLSVSPIITGEKRLIGLVLQVFDFEES